MAARMQLKNGTAGTTKPSRATSNPNIRPCARGIRTRDEAASGQTTRDERRGDRPARTGTSALRLARAADLHRGNAARHPLLPARMAVHARDGQADDVLALAGSP